MRKGTTPRCTILKNSKSDFVEYKSGMFNVEKFGKWKVQSQLLEKNAILTVSVNTYKGLLVFFCSVLRLDLVTMLGLALVSQALASSLALLLTRVECTQCLET